MDGGWRRLAEYPVRYATGHWSTDPVLCARCAPLAVRRWNWEGLPYPRSSGVRVTYAHPDHPVEPGSACSACGTVRGP